MAKGDRSVNPFRDDNDIRQDMDEDLERRYEDEMDRRDKARKKARKKLSDKEALKSKNKGRASRNLLKDADKFKPSKKAQSDLTSWIVEHAEFSDKEVTKRQRRGVAKRVSRSVISGLKAAGSKIGGPAAAAGLAVGLVNKHKEIKSKPKSRYGSKSLMEILK